MQIPFNKPYMTGRELFYISQAHFNNHLSGDGIFTKLCHTVIEKHLQRSKALLTHSCTAALEMAAILINIKPGDEVIMPSYTFVSTANAFVLRGGIPVFVDIRPDTINLNELLIESAVTSKTRAIVPVHYAGVGCEMDKILEIAKNYNLYVIEDAAQGMMAYYKQKSLGSIGDLGAYSFHETKNIISGEGGCLLINNTNFIKRAEIIREKGTNRTEFFKGEVDKYTWQDIGSSFLPGEITAAFLLAQLEQAKVLTQKRLTIWRRYHMFFKSAEIKGLLRRPIIPIECKHSAHMYYILLPECVELNKVLIQLKQKNIGAVSHYVPLHTAPAGQKYCKTFYKLSVTESISRRLIRLPMWIGLNIIQQEYIVTEVINAIKKSYPTQKKLVEGFVPYQIKTLVQKKDVL